MTELVRQIHGSATVYRLGWTLLHTLWIGAAAAALLAVALVVLRRRSANARYIAACAALALLALSPAATFMLVPAPLRPEAPAPSDAVAPPALPAPGRPLPAVAGAAPGPASKPQAVPSAPPAPVRAVEPAKPPLTSRLVAAVEPAMPWLVLAWAAGVCLLSLRQLGGWIAAGRLKRLATAPPGTDLAANVARLARRVGVSRPVRVLESALVKVPGAIGWLKPVILLPAGLATGLAPRQIEAILIHELIHVRRCDYLVNLLQSLIETLLFYHPAVWFISGRIRTERENCCDDLVLAAGAERVCYAESLLHVAQRSGSARRPVAAVAATGRPSQLRTRIARLLGMGDETTLRLARSWPIALVLVAAILVAGSVWMSARAEPAPDKPLGPAAREIAGRFTDRLSRQRLPFLTPEKIDSLRNELQTFLAGKCPTDVTDPTLRAVLKSLDGYVPVYFPDDEHTYLDFPDRIATLKWKLWLALNRKPLTDAETSVLARQRSWLRSYVGSVPEKLPSFTRADRLRRLEALFADPLMPWYKKPLTEAQFAGLQDELRSLPDEVKVHFIINRVVSKAAQVQYPRGEVSGFPFTAGVTYWGMASGMTWVRLDLTFGDNRPWKGSGFVLRDIEADRGLLDVRTPTVVRPPAGIDSESKLEAWARQQGRGDIGYDDARGGGLFAIRGARMAVFKASDWLAVDRMSAAALKKLVEEQSKRVVPLRGIPELLPKPDTYVAVVTAEGELSVMRINSVDSESVILHVRSRRQEKETRMAPAGAGEAAGRRLEFRGKVVDDSGQPVAGARVTALQGSDRGVSAAGRVSEPVGTGRSG